MRPLSSLRSSMSAFRSRRGRDVLIYLGFCLVAFVFWVMLSLNTEVQRDYEVPVVLDNVPDSLTLINPFPATIAVSVKAKDTQLLRFRWGRMGTLHFKWEELSTQQRLEIPRTVIEAKLRDYFGSGVKIVTFRPDTIRSPFTSQAPIRVPIELVTDIHTGSQYTISGPIRANVDSVDVYATGAAHADVSFAQTEILIKTGLRDTTRYVVHLKPIKGVRMIPDRVTVMVPVEPLISKRRSIIVDVLNAPEGKSVVTFPTKVDIDYLVPMSKYSTDYPVKAFADYAGRVGGKLPIILADMPELYRSPKVRPDSVEYIIEELTTAHEPAESQAAEPEGAESTE